ncbi:septum formation initiator family protein [Streptomyces sp. NPDC006208]|uniref:FtsB family cell division protein n=1 Tax=Streptomyces sp. NPDC006208 TaxID=3156734 RepID=UPI0033B0FFBE
MSTAAKQLKGRAAQLARLMPSGPSTAARTPFVLLVVLLLSGGLITLLLLNSSLNQGSFKLSELKKRTTDLTDQEQALQRDVDSRSAPDALERRARELGMVPGGNPAFLGPDGKIHGVPDEATAQAIPDPTPLASASLAAPSVTASPTPTAPPAAAPPTAAAPPSASPSAAAAPSASPSAAASGSARPPATPPAATRAPRSAAPQTLASAPSAASAPPVSASAPRTSPKPTPTLPGR